MTLHILWKDVDPGIAEVDDAGESSAFAHGALTFYV
jgi:hypothetical protein